MMRISATVADYLICHGGFILRPQSLHLSIKVQSYP